MRHKIIMTVATAAIVVAGTVQYVKIIKGANKLMEEVWNAASEDSAGEARVTDTEG